ncbi:MAG: hypothetical protein ABJD68_16025, partial [Nakamurella sp.]
VYASLGASEPGAPTGGPGRRAYLTITIMFVVVGIPLIANTVGSYIVTLLTARAQTAAEQWISQTPGGQVQSLVLHSNRIDVNIEVPGAAPPTDDLMTALSEQLPGGIQVYVNTTVGSSVNAGETQ